MTDGLRGNAFWMREPDSKTGKPERFPAVISLSVTFGLIAGGVLVSLWKTPGAARCLREDMMLPVVQRLCHAVAAAQGERVSMRAMAQAHGPESHGTLLLLLAMPCLLPVPGVATVLGQGMTGPVVAMGRGRCMPCSPQWVGVARVATIGRLLGMGLGPRVDPGLGSKLNGTDR